MPAPTATITTAAGQRSSLTEDIALALPAGPVAIDVTSVAGRPIPVDATTILFDFTGPKPKALAWDSTPPYRLAYVVAADAVLGVKVQAHDGSELAMGKYRIKAGPGVPAVPTPPAGPTPEAEPPASPAWSAFGACCDYGSAPAIVQRLARLGVTHLRFFGPTIPANGSPGTRHFAYVNQITKLAPGVKCVVLHGPHEQARDDAGRISVRAMPLADEGVRKRYWAELAKMLAPFGDDYVVELFNEVNLKQYFDLGQDDNKVSADVVKYMAREAEIVHAARAAVGGKFAVWGPSIGYRALPRLHGNYLHAFVDAGMGEHVDAWTGHVYPNSGLQQAEDQLGGMRDAVGYGKPLHLTELGVQYMRIADAPANLAKLMTTVRQCKATPHYYRAAPEAGVTRAADPVSLLRSDYKANSAICAAAGLTVVTP